MSESNNALIDFIRVLLLSMQDTNTKDIELAWHQYGTDNSQVQLRAKR